MSDAAGLLGPVLALDIGGTKLATAIVTPDGTHHGLMIEPTRREEGPDAVLRRLFDLGKSSIKAAGIAPAAVGISCGGPLDATAGVLVCPPHLPGWIDIPICALTEREYGVPTVLENDATAAALAEFRFGAGVGAENLIYLTISTGIGGGVVIGSQLYRGATGNGGELGHITVRPGGRHCVSCKRRGCLEAYCSGTQIAARATEAVTEAKEAGRPTTLADISPLTAADVSQAAAAGDALAAEVWQETVVLLGQALTDLVNVFEPDVAVLGGGVTRSGAMLLEPIAKIVRETGMGREAKVVRLELATLGDVVGVIGAAAIAWDRLGVA
ncbi:MAG: ROK family protein [Promicromonosporaceae bacterium]|nr:ROK family protein [Promicromonosporaceae bacterium]